MKYNNNQNTIIMFINDEVVVQYKNTNYGASAEGHIYNMKARRRIKGSRIDANREYLAIKLGRRNKKIHIIIAELFVPNDNPSTKTVVHHIDGNKTNNKANNLAWMSEEEHRHIHKDDKNKCSVAALEFPAIFNTQVEAARWFDMANSSGISDNVNGKKEYAGKLGESKLHWVKVTDSTKLPWLSKVGE